MRLKIIKALESDFDAVFLDMENRKG